MATFVPLSAVDASPGDPQADSTNTAATAPTSTHRRMGILLSGVGSVPTAPDSLTANDQKPVRFAGESRIRRPTRGLPREWLVRGAFGSLRKRT
ncbi:hypothetical protein GCM10010112_89400 [Actinoplanes lobatus]|uniref:Uncharacterized protein n=1 Tax=Actinoplanes lobatus TaxID=113568 RepID=A0ABQ4AXB5_9ACTN|nr:hypothetical protein GCM10010112_89400 [Actinoplanes lobatus]GIE45679.1 hypothetical protein Alo02nite_85770 [Actinoplanes lobatus]